MFYHPSQAPPSGTAGRGLGRQTACPGWSPAIRTRAAAIPSARIPFSAPEGLRRLSPGFQPRESGTAIPKPSATIPPGAREPAAAASPALGLSTRRSARGYHRTISQLLDLTRERVVVYDGSMGATILNMQLTAADYGGKEGCNDYLVLCNPSIVENIHAAYLETGVDV